MSTKRDESLLKTAQQRYKLGVDADQKQKESELEALRMYAGDQWPADVRRLREAQDAVNGIPGTPARPCLTVNRLREPVAQVLNQERNSDLSIELVPADDFGAVAEPLDPTEIELREGLIRRIQRESESADARTWAFARAVICGRGYYAVMTRYVEGKTWDQEVYCQRVYNQNSVVLDPTHEQPDGSDAEWGFIGNDLPFEQYKAEFPRAKNGKDNALTEVESDADWRALGDEAPGWFSFQGDKKVVRVVDYWYTERTTRELAELPDGSAVWVNELPEGFQPMSTRPVVEKKIKFCKLDGLQVLEETEWPSPYLPIIKIVGNELPPYDQQRKVEGMVQPSIDSQRGSNYMLSRWIELIGLAPIPPFMVAEGQIEGYENWYQLANVRTLPWLPYKTRDLEGNPVGAPQRTNVETPIGAIAASVQMFNEAIQTTTGVNDPQMGKTDPSLRSGRAIMAVQEQGQRGTSNYMDNFVRSVRHEGRIMNSLLYPIYGRRPGRMARIVNGEDDAESVLIGQPFIQQGGQPGAPGMPVPAPSGAPGAREFKLTPNANYNVAVKVSKNYDTRRQQEANMNAELVSANPSLMTVGGDLFFKAQDGPGAQEWADRMRVMLDPKVLAMLEQAQGGEAPIPPQAMQQMQGMQQQMQQMQGMLQQAQQELQTQQAKIQAEKEIAYLKSQTEIELQRMKLESDQMIAAAKLDDADRQALARIEAERQRQQVAHAQAIDQATIEASLQPAEAAEPMPEPGV